MCIYCTFKTTCSAMKTHARICTTHATFEKWKKAGSACSGTWDKCMQESSSKKILCQLREKDPDPKRHLSILFYTWLTESCQQFVFAQDSRYAVPIGSKYQSLLFWNRYLYCHGFYPWQIPSYLQEIAPLQDLNICGQFILCVLGAFWTNTSGMDFEWHDIQKSNISLSFPIHFGSIFQATNNMFHSIH